MGEEDFKGQSGTAMGRGQVKECPGPGGGRAKVGGRAQGEEADWSWGRGACGGVSLCRTPARPRFGGTAFPGWPTYQVSAPGDTGTERPLWAPGTGLTGPPSGETSVSSRVEPLCP